MSKSSIPTWPYKGLRAHKAKIDLAYKLFVSGESIRKSARQVQVSPSTIQRWNDRFYRQF